MKSPFGKPGPPSPVIPKPSGEVTNVTAVSLPGQTALSADSSCCSKPQPSVPTVAMQLKSVATCAASDMPSTYVMNGGLKVVSLHPVISGLATLLSLPSSPKPVQPGTP